MSEILEALKGGDRRSIGRVAEVVAEAEANPGLFVDLFEGMLVDDQVVRMRAADAVEKITISHPEYLSGYKQRLLGEVAEINQQEVRWHLAQMIPRLALDDPEVDQAVGILIGFLDDKSSIVRTFSLQALADLAMAHPRLASQVKTIIEDQSRTGSPAVRSRGRKLLKNF